MNSLENEGARPLQERVIGTLEGVGGRGGRGLYFLKGHKP